MQLTTYIKLIFVISILFTGCSTSNKKSIEIDLDNKEQVSIGDIFGRFEIAPLETSPKSLIYGCDKIVYHDQKYYLLDIKQKALLIYNDRGLLLNIIKEIGRGPNEYTELSDFDINPYTNHIELLTPRGRILIYNQDAQFVRSFIIRGVRATHYFINVSKDIIVIYQNFEKKRLSFYSRKQKIILKELYNIPKYVSYHTQLNTRYSPFYRYKDTICFHDVFSNNIYYIDNMTLKDRFFWNFGKYNFDISKLPQGKSANYNIDFLKNSNYAYYITNIIENDDYLFTSFLFKKKWLNVILLKNEDKYLIFNKYKEGIGVFIPHLFDEGIYVVINPNQIQLGIRSELLDQKSSKMLKNVKLTDNPVIIKYFFK